MTILTGHLGAGKTTLLKRLLNNTSGLRIAVIENEFGNEVGIERLIAGSSNTIKRSEDLFVELSNGCVCCSVKDTLVQTLETLVEKSRERFDHIVIETTGLADPGPLAGVFWLDDELESKIVLDGVVTVVDLLNVLPRLDDTKANEAKMQIAYADRIILNKRELITAKAFDVTLKRIQAINPIAPVSVCTFANADFDFCLNVHAFDSARLRLSLAEDGLAHHDPLISHVVLRRSNRAISIGALRSWLGTLLWEPTSPDCVVYRIKGLIWADEESNLNVVHVVQAVHKIFDIEASKDGTWTDVGESGPITKIVVIGKGLNAVELQKQFDSL